MKTLNPEPIYCAVERLLDEIECQTIARDDASDAFEFSPDKLDRLAKTLTVQLKALSDLQAYNRKVEDENKSQKYLDYEDLPPPSPEDRDRLIARIRLLYNRVNAEEEISEIDEDPS